MPSLIIPTSLDTLDVTPPGSPVQCKIGRKLTRSQAIIYTRDPTHHPSKPNRTPEEIRDGVPFGRLGPATHGFQPTASEIIPRLYVSDVFTATSKQTLDKLRITHVLSVMLDQDIPTTDLSALRIQPTRLTLPILDRMSASLYPILSGAVEFIADALSDPNARVLCHCYAGASRSTSVIVAYLASSTDMTVDEALAFIRRKRSISQPNPGFVVQLRAWEKDHQRRESAEDSSGTTDTEDEG